MGFTHNKLKCLAKEKLISEGYKIIGSEVVIEDIIINGSYIIVDLLVEKNGQKIPVECGIIKPPKQERMLKLKEKFGQVKHFRYGYNKALFKAQEQELKNKPDIEKEVYINMKPQEYKKIIQIPSRPKCSNCDSLNVYVLQDKTIVCRRCGHRELKKDNGLSIKDKILLNNCIVENRQLFKDLSKL